MKFSDIDFQNYVVYLRKFDKPFRIEKIGNHFFFIQGGHKIPADDYVQYVNWKDSQLDIVQVVRLEYTFGEKVQAKIIYQQKFDYTFETGDLFIGFLCDGKEVRSCRAIIVQNEVFIGKDLVIPIEYRFINGIPTLAGDSNIRFYIRDIYRYAECFNQSSYETVLYRNGITLEKIQEYEKSRS